MDATKNTRAKDRSRTWTLVWSLPLFVCMGSFFCTSRPSCPSFTEGGGTEGFPADVKTVRYCLSMFSNPSDPPTTTTTLIPSTLGPLSSSHLSSPVKPLQSCRYDTKFFFVLQFFSPLLHRAWNCVSWEKEKEKKTKKHPDNAWINVSVAAQLSEEGKEKNKLSFSLLPKTVERHCERSKNNTDV